MAEVHEEIAIAATPDAVWSVGGDVGGIAEWLPTIATCRMEGDLRIITTDDGGTATERITSHDDATRSYTYEFVEGSFPFATYRSRFSVAPEGDGSRATWHADLTADDTISDADLVAAIGTSYRNALAALRDIGEGR